MENVNKSAKRFLKRNIVVIIVAITLMNVSLIGIIIKTGLDKKKNTISLVNEYINNIQMNITKDIYTNETLDLTIYDVEDGQINEKLINDDKITCEKFTVKDGAVLYAYNCKVGNSKTTYDYNKEDKVYPSTEKKEIKKEEKKIIYKDAILNGADPILSDNLIPVIITSDGEVTKADLYEKWYDYTNKEWANAVILKADAKVGEDNKINLDDIESYFVWIPRYKYKLFNTEFNKINKETIDIVFENKDVAKTEGKVNGEYLTHPAFSMQEELNGLWVGKFETTGNIDNITIRPNETSITSQNLNATFTASYNYKRDNDSHLIRNVEWGSVAYLAMSKYGINDDIRINNTSDHKTGYGAKNVNGDATSSSSELTGDYKSASGLLASTTGNITGIYDMAGGVWEHVAAYRANANGINGVNRSGLNINDYDAKYFDIYQNTNTILGDATGETNGWFEDRVNYINYNAPWYLRSGYYKQGASAGIFYIGNDVGTSDSRIGFRIALTK